MQVNAYAGKSKHRSQGDAGREPYGRHIRAEVLIEASPQAISQRKGECGSDRRGLDDEQGDQQCPGKHNSSIARVPLFSIVEQRLQESVRERSTPRSDNERLS